MIQKTINNIIILCKKKNNINYFDIITLIFNPLLKCIYIYGYLEDNGYIIPRL